MPPDMAYLENKIQHTGISTLKQYHQKGFAKKCVALNTHQLLQKGIVPQWKTDADNLASISPAESIGYKKYAKAMIYEQ